MVVGVIENLTLIRLTLVITYLDLLLCKFSLKMSHV